MVDHPYRPRHATEPSREFRTLRIRVRIARRLLQSWCEVSRMVDAQMLHAALDIAADRSATNLARIGAFKLLIRYKGP
jgi:hypothetical protein